MWAGFFERKAKACLKVWRLLQFDLEPVDSSAMAPTDRAEPWFRSPGGMSG